MRFPLFLAVLLVLTAAALFLLPLVGTAPAADMYWSVYWKFRFHRTLLAILAGGGLALSGLVFQTMFRNPLATPYTLGIASGASFGAALFLQSGIHFGFTMTTATFLGVPFVSFGAFGGAILAMLFVFALSRFSDVSSEQMLLAGVAVNFFFASLIVLLQYVSAPHDAVQMLRWTMGGVQNAMPKDNLLLAPVVLFAAVALSFFSRELNIITTGKERAESLGINVAAFRTALFILTSLLVGAVVSITGPIAFVGLMVPHVARMFTGVNHLRQIPATVCFGAVFLAVCDTAGRTLLFPTQLPVGIITGLLGGPFFLWLLLRKTAV
ncbi:MAG: iron ABC transporter permease [Planctomycetaceae bacterium]|nr:iron ABC transporter permease [Planctomycetaceae bacterium]